MPWLKRFGSETFTSRTLLASREQRSTMLTSHDWLMAYTHSLCSFLIDPLAHLNSESAKMRTNVKFHVP